MGSTNVSDLNFGDGSWEDARGVVQNTLQEVVLILKGNGREGMKTTLETFIATYNSNRKADIEFRDLRDKENGKRESRRWKLATIAIAFIGLMVSTLASLDGCRMLHGNFTTAEPSPALQSWHGTTEDAGGATGTR